MSDEDKGYFDGDEWKNKKPDDDGDGGENENPADADGSDEDDADEASDPMEMAVNNPFMAAMTIAHLASLLEFTKQQLLFSTSALSATQALIIAQHNLIEAQKQEIEAHAGERSWLYVMVIFLTVVSICVFLVLLYFLATT